MHERGDGTVAACPAPPKGGAMRRDQLPGVSFWIMPSSTAV